MEEFFLVDSFRHLEAVSGNIFLEIIGKALTIIKAGDVFIFQKEMSRMVVGKNICYGKQMDECDPGVSCKL
jgi:hypothetical protein